MHDALYRDGGFWIARHSRLELGAGNLKLAWTNDRLGPYLSPRMARLRAGRGFGTSFSDPATPQRPAVEVVRVYTHFGRGVRIQLPLWQIAAVAGFPALFLAERNRRQHRRRRKGLCLWCGYDLRGGQRQCPECGGLSEYPSGTASGGLG